MNPNKISDKVTLIIPAYNESRSIGKVLTEVKTLYGNELKNIIVVDDASIDDTSTIARQMGIEVIRHKRNLGYGAALKTGIHAAKTDFVLIMDADGQHNPADIQKFLKNAESFDMVVGARQGFMDGPLWRKPGKKCITWLANYLSQTKIPDLTCGFRLFKREIILKYLHLCPNGFSFSTTSTLVMINRGYNLTYIPLYVRKREAGSISTVKIRTGFQTILLIFRLMMLLNPIRIFIPSSIFFITSGTVLGVYYYLHGSGLVGTALVLVMTGILLFFFGLIADQIAEIRKERFE